MKKVWDVIKGDMVDMPKEMEDFLNDIKAVCEKHGLSISHEDYHGEVFTVEEYAEEMKGIFSTCINQSTIDEAPFVYKDYQEIMECIEPTVEIIARIVPIFNFKANE